MQTNEIPLRPSTKNGQWFAIMWLTSQQKLITKVEEKPPLISQISSKIAFFNSDDGFGASAKRRRSVLPGAPLGHGGFTELLFWGLQTGNHINKLTSRNDLRSTWTCHKMKFSFGMYVNEGHFTTVATDSLTIGFALHERMDQQYCTWTRDGFRS